MHVTSVEKQVQFADAVAEAAPALRQSISAAIRVDLPFACALERWRQFDEFPHFMRGSEQAHTVDGSRMVWRIHFDGAWVPWDAEVIHMHVDDGIFWENHGARRPCSNSGKVTFIPETLTTTRIHITCEFAPVSGDRRVAESMGELAARLQRGLASFHEALTQCGDESVGSPPADDLRRAGWLALRPADRAAIQALSEVTCPFSACPE